ncbi:MAG: DNA translocase FtsK, partial [Bacteroidales bacterium]
LRNLIILTLLISILLSFIFGKSIEFLGSGPGGAHGYYLSQWLIASIGYVGTAFLLFICFLGFFLFTFNRLPNFSLKRKKKEPSVEFSEKEKHKTEYLKDDPGFEVDAGEKSETLELEKEEPEKKQEEVTDNQDIELTVEETSEEESHNKKTIEEDYDPTLDLSSYRFPDLSLLKDHETGNPRVSNEELMSNKNKIIDTLANYKITIDKIKATIGPTVTLYEIVPAPGIRISKIKNLEDDIALSLSALGIRIIAPIPGKGTIGIEVPNQQPRIVSMKNVLSSKKFQETNFVLPVALGKTISNETFVFDLTKMPHLLMAGATGQGKSVGLNAIIASLLY